MDIPSRQDCRSLCGLGVDVTSSDDLLVPSLWENELDNECGNGGKTQNSSSYDSDRLSRELSTKNASATRTSSTERGRRDLERINDDRCIIQ